MIYAAGWPGSFAGQDRILRWKMPSLKKPLHRFSILAFAFSEWLATRQSAGILWLNPAQTGLEAVIAITPLRSSGFKMLQGFPMRLHPATFSTGRTAVQSNRTTSTTESGRVP